MTFHVDTRSFLVRAAVIAAMLVFLVVAGNNSPAAALPPEDADDERPSEAAPEEGEEPESEPKKTDYSETVVVTASRTEQTLQDTPAAVSVIEGDQIVQAPVDDYGDILRNVAGSNTVQMNARDVLFTSRQATSVIPAGQLAMVDNRTIYQDYNGFVMWDTIPLDPYEIKRVEAVRGPGSAVWGANAVNGIVNIITKSPQEMLGTRVTLGGGEIGTAFGSVTHAGASGNGKVGYKVTGAYYEQDAYDRPTGTIPGTDGPGNPGGTQYPGFLNDGTQQPKFNFRVDYDQNDDTTWSFTGGYGQTDGIIWTPGGPWQFEDGAGFGYFKFDWTNKSKRVTFFANDVDYDAVLLLGRGQYRFQNQTYNVDFTDTRLVGTRHVLTYGANVRRNQYDLDFAPAADTQNEAGVFLEDDMHLAEKFRWVIGARFDYHSAIDYFVSPRTSFLISPSKQQTFRLSYNRAYLAPTAVQRYIQLPAATVLTVPVGGEPVTIVAPWTNVGNDDLVEQKLDAYEVAWIGSFRDRATVTVAAYRNEFTDFIKNGPTEFYTSAAPPPGWPLPPGALDVPPPNGFAGVLPSEFAYNNVGDVVNKGVDLTVEGRPAPAWSVLLNYSWQDDPEVSGLQQVPLPNGDLVYPVNLPPEHRFNIGAAWDGKRFYANANANYASEAFWTDVLDQRFWGPSDAYTIFNVGAGVRLGGGTYVIGVYGQNVFDERAQQHVWGDIIGRKIYAQVSFAF